MKWSREQDNALVAVRRWFNEGGPQVYRLFGYAGTGKTTLARHFGEGIEGLVLYMAFTGKAAHVMRQSGCPGASTIHSAIYHTKEKGRARLKELEASLAETLYELGLPERRQEVIDRNKVVVKLRKEIAEERQRLAQPAFSLNQNSLVCDAALVVIDECSMVDDRLGSDLLSFGTRVLVLGDPAQLAPVAGAGFFTTGVEPDTVLTEIHRQAAENPILAMATEVRQGRHLKLGTYGESRVVDASEINSRDALDADQILVGRNATRRSSNRRMRHLLNRGAGLPVVDDRLVCLRNNHDLGLLNGALWHLSLIHISEPTRPY